MKSCPQCSATYPDDYAVCPKDGAALQETSLWQVNTVIRGRYKILALIGEGGMATVYKAHHQLLDELRALKVIKPELARDALFVQRFKNEAIITRKLQHANAVRVDDLDIAEDGRPFISMEYVEGESLKTLIQRAGPLGAAKTLGIALQVCQALDAAHALGLIHRDIKPDNVYLVPRGEGLPLAKVLDFGIARLKETAPGGTRVSGMTLTGTGVVIGTPEYMSPEQAMGKHGEELDGRSDLYSLGIVMYRMLTGELPFKAITTVEMILHHIQTIPKAPQALKPELGIPDDVSALVMRALDKDREKRFPSAGSMAEAIRQAQERTLLISRAVAPAPTPVARGGMVAAAPPAQAPKPPAAAAPGPSAAAVRPPARHSPSAAPPQPAPVIRAAPAVVKGKARTRSALIWAGVGLALVVSLIYANKRRRLHEAPVAPPAPATTQVVPPTSGPPASAAGSEKNPAGPVESAAAPETKTPAAVASVPAASEKKPAGPVESAAAPGTKTPAAVTSVPAAEPKPNQEVVSHSNPPPPEAAEQTESAPGPRPIDQMKARAQGFVESGQYAKAAQVFRRILEIRPNDQEALKGLVNCLQEQGQRFFGTGQYGRAAALFRQILEIQPNHRWAQQHLQQCQQKIREQRQTGEQPF